MNQSTPPALSPRFAVVGGGISGLTAAYRLRTLLPEAEVELFESETRLGGVLCTAREGDVLLECGADSFITKQPWASELCEELGIASHLIPTNPADRRAMVLFQGKLYPVPEGFFMLRPQKALPILQSELLSWRGKARLFAEPFVRPAADIDQPGYDVSLAQFASHRLGQEAFERLVEPLLAGIYTADATRLSVAATMPDALEQVRRHGSLLKAMLREKRTEPSDKNAAASGARYGAFVTPRAGVGQLVDELAQRLAPGKVHTGCTISQLSRTDSNGWNLGAEDGSQEGPYAGVVLALPAHASAQLIAPLKQPLSQELEKIEYASSAIVCFLFDKTAFPRPVEGFGYVVPRVEQSPIVACSYASQKFPGRCPDSQIILRVFLGGALDPGAVELADETLAETALQAVRGTLGAVAEPRLTKVVRWRRRMPQYHVGHLDKVARIQELVAEVPGLELAGNAYRGVGIPYCVRTANEAATRLVDWFREAASSRGSVPSA